jgi:hypothetical protein
LILIVASLVIPRIDDISLSLIKPATRDTDIDPGGPGSTVIEWTDPATGETFIVDPKSGDSSLKRARADDDAGDIIGSAQNSSTYVDKRWLTYGTRLSGHDCGPAGSGLPSWINEALQVRLFSCPLKQNMVDLYLMTVIW